MFRLATSAFAVGVCLSLGQTGCATIFTGTHDDLKVESAPASAKITILDRDGDTVETAITPHTFSLKRTEIKYVVRIQLDGYQDAEMRIDREFNFWTLCNIACGGIIGGAVDFIDGAAWHLDPDTVSVTLAATSRARPVAPTAPPAPAAPPPEPDDETRASGEGDSRLSVVFYTRDDQGRLRMLSVPLIRRQAVLAAR